MVKIVKDMLTNVTKGLSKLPEFNKSTVTCVHNLCQLETIQNLLRRREASLYNALVNKMGDLRSNGKSPYDILMKHVSDEMQDLATSYGERIAMEQSILAVNTKLQNPDYKRILSTHFKIYGIEVILNNLGFFLSEEAISVDAAKQLREKYRELIREAAQSIDTIINNLNVPVHALHTPIAGDYVKYNEKPYNGEVLKAKL